MPSIATIQCLQDTFKTLNSPSGGPDCGRASGLVGTILELHCYDEEFRKLNADYDNGVISREEFWETGWELECCYPQG